MIVPRKGIHAVRTRQRARGPRRPWSLEKGIIVFWAVVVVVASLVAGLAALRGVGQD